MPLSNRGKRIQVNNFLSTFKLSYFGIILQDANLDYLQHFGFFQTLRKLNILQCVFFYLKAYQCIFDRVGFPSP